MPRLPFSPDVVIVAVLGIGILGLAAWKQVQAEVADFRQRAPRVAEPRDRVAPPPAPVRRPVQARPAVIVYEESWDEDDAPRVSVQRGRHCR